VRVPGVVGRDVAGTLAERVWVSLAARGVDRARPATWPVGFVGKNQGLRRGRVFDAFGAAAATVAVVDELGAGSWSRDGVWGPALVTFPEPGPWTLPHKVWHFDLPGQGDPDRPHVVRLFGYVDDVVEHGGATLVVEGSHELVRRLVAATPGHDAGSSAELRMRLMADHPWFRALGRESGAGDAGGADRIRQFMVDGDEIDGVRVRVAELTAGAGDVVVMQPWTMHNLSMNCADRPRFMVTHSIYRQS
jgi:ectoine hydroxylase-related dioxygenase (phytanoyl-CoA dioxygenase family)